MRRIILNNLKGIKKLQFDLPGTGVWLLTGGNGSGKTSLLACLDRIGNPLAFPIHFPSSKELRLDSFRSASIEYHAGAHRVTYIRGSERWVPRPRKDSSPTLKAFGYNSVIYLGANAERITAKPDDLKPGRSSAASDFIRFSAKEILGDDRFLNLRTVNASRSQAFLLRYGAATPFSYNSERNLSLGELSVVKMLRSIETVADNSLLLVDELEMALHPNAQIKLYEFLRRLCAERNLTVIFSTHSATLIKHVKRSSILHLEKNGAEHIITRSAFPTYILGQMAGLEERGYDILMLCEDEAAEEILENWWLDYQKDQHALNKPIPKLLVSPTGSFKQVLRTLEGSLTVNPNHVKVVAVLDHDVTSETIPNLRISDPHCEFLQRYDRMSNSVLFLPFTPELGVVECVADHKPLFLAELRKALSDFQIQLSDALGWIDQVNLSDAKRRELAKSCVKNWINEIEVCSRKDSLRCRRAVFGAFATVYGSTNVNEVRALKGRLFG